MAPLTLSFRFNSRLSKLFEIMQNQVLQLLLLLFGAGKLFTPFVGFCLLPWQALPPLNHFLEIIDILCFARFLKRRDWPTILIKCYLITFL